MGGLKKGKGGSKSRTSKGKEGTGKTKEPKRQQDDWQREAQGSPQERVAAVKPFWETLTQEERVQLLSITLEDLRQKAKEVTERQRKQAAAEAAELAAENPDGGPVTINLEPTLDDVLEEGIRRLQDKNTWKLWQWPMGGKEFYDADSFRQCIQQEALDENLRKLLPKDEGKPVERPAEAALRMRMTELLQKVHQNTRQLQDDMGYPKRAGGRGPNRITPDQIHNAVRDTNIELITMMLEHLEKEHEFLYHAVLFPVTSFVCEMLPDNARESSRTELFFEDLEKLPPEEVARICEWLTEKVDGFGSKIKPEPKDVEEQEEEEGIGDVDLFSLAADNTELTVNAKWLQHLQERLLGEDGHPRKVNDGEDPHRMGLVLEWVYGTIVSTAEKARDGAKRSLGGRPPIAQQAYDQLVQALRDQQNWEARAKTAKDLLNEMLTSRKDAAKLVEEGYDLRPVPGADDPQQSELPDRVILTVLKREVLLTRAKLHHLCYDHLMSERKLRTLKAQLRQGEPEFDRLKRELEDVKNQPRGLEGTFRTAAEMERHRAQLADQAIEEQLEVQTAFREHGSRLQTIYDKRQRTEIEMARREQEMKQLNGWKSTVQTLVDRFEELLNAPPAIEDSPAVEDEGSLVLRNAAGALTQPHNTLEKLHVHFQKDVRRQLYTIDDDRTFFDWIQRELKSVEKRLEDGRAALQHLEMFLISVACDDPGAAIGAQLALPLLQERLDARAMEYAAMRAREAELAIIKMEEEKMQKELAEKEKKQKQKQKMKEKGRAEKEKQLAEKEAKERAEREQLEEEERARAEQEEQERQRKLEELERARKKSDEEMEARRIELLSRDGFYRQRDEQKKKDAALEEPLLCPIADEDVPEASSNEGELGDRTTPRGDAEGFRDSDSRRPRRSNRPQPRRNAVEAPVGEGPERANGFIPRNGRVYPEQPKAIPLQGPERDTARAPPVTRSEGPPSGPFGGPQGPRPPRAVGEQVGRDQHMTGPQRLRLYSSTDGLPTAQQLERGGEGRPRSATVKPRPVEPVVGERPAMARNVQTRGGLPGSESRVGQLNVQPAPSVEAQAAPNPVAEEAEAQQPVPPPPVSLAGPMQLQFGEFPPTGLPSPAGPPSPRATAAPPTGPTPLGAVASNGPPRPASPARHTVGNDVAGEANLPVFGTYAEGIPLMPADLQVPLPHRGGFENGPHPQSSVPNSGPSTSAIHPGAPVLLPPHPPHHDSQGPGTQPFHTSGRPQPSLRKPPPVVGGSPLPAPAPSVHRNETSAPSAGPGPAEKQFPPHKQVGNTGHFGTDMMGQGSGPLRARPQPRRTQEAYASQGPPHGQPSSYQAPNGMPPRMANGAMHGSVPTTLANGIPMSPHVMGLPPASLQSNIGPPPPAHIARAKQGVEMVRAGSAGLGRGSSPAPMPLASGGALPHLQGHLNPMQQPPPNGLRGLPATPVQSPVRPHQAPLPQGAPPMSPTAGRFPPSPAGPAQMGSSVRNQQQHGGRGGPLPGHPPPMMGPQAQHGGPIGGAGNIQHHPGGQGQFQGVPPQQMGGSLPMMNSLPHLYNNAASGGPMPVGSPTQRNPNLFQGGYHPPGAPPPHMMGQHTGPGVPPHGPAFIHATPYMHGPQPMGNIHGGNAMLMMGPQPQHGMGNSHGGPPIHMGPNQMGFSPPSAGMMHLPHGNVFPPTHPGGVGGPPKDGMQQGWMPGGRGGTSSLRRNGQFPARSSALSVNAPAFVPGANTFPSAQGNRMVQRVRSRENLDTAQPAMEVPHGGSSEPRGSMKVAAPYQEAAPVVRPSLPESGHGETPSSMHPGNSKPVLQPPSAAEQDTSGQTGLPPASTPPALNSSVSDVVTQATTAPFAVATEAAIPGHPLASAPPDSVLQAGQLSDSPAAIAPAAPQATTMSHPSPPKSPMPVQPAPPARDSPPTTSATSAAAGASTTSSAPQAPQSAVPQPTWSTVAARDGAASTSSKAGPGRDRPQGNSVPGADYELSPRDSTTGSQGRQGSRRGEGSASATGHVSIDAAGNPIPRVNSAASVSSTASNSSAHTGDKRKVTRAGGVVWEGLEGDIARLKLVRGLSNETGYNNCFLNVVIQSLWHLGSFRKGLLSIQPQALEGSGHPPEDLRVLRALWNIFSAFSQPLEELALVDEEQAESPASSSTGTTEGAEVPVKRSRVEGRNKPRPTSASATSFTVSPTELREALSSLDQTAIQFELSEMHDASEVLSEIFNSLHRAESGIPRPGAIDPQLPQKVRVPAPGAPLANGAAAPLAELAPVSMVQKLFGLVVQVPMPSDDDESTMPNKRPKGTGGWQEQTSRSHSQRQQQAAAAGPPVAPKKAKDPNFVEVQQYIKYFHLVPAQGLRAAFDHMVGTFEEMLQYADRAEGLAKGAVHTLDITLLRPPPVLTLALVWDSPIAAQEAISSSVNALKTELNASKVFKGLPASRGAYTLRCIVCYFGHHYQAYTLSEELNQWLLFDDTNIKLIGQWKDVAASIRNSRHQPSLLFYEHV